MRLHVRTGDKTKSNNSHLPGTVTQIKQLHVVWKLVYFRFQF